MIKMPPQAYTKEVLAAAFDWLASQPEYVREKITSSDDLVGMYLKSTRLNNEAKSDLSSAKNFRNELQDLAQNLKQFEEKEEKKEEKKQTSKPENFRPASQPSTDFKASPPIDTTSRSQQDFAAVKNKPAVSSSHKSEPHINSSIKNTKSDSYGQELINSNPNLNPRSIAMPSNKFEAATPTHQEPANKTSNIANDSASNPDEKPMPEQKSIKSSASSDSELVFKIDDKTKNALSLAKDRLNLSSDSEALRVLVSLGEKHLKKLFGPED